MLTALHSSRSQATLAGLFLALLLLVGCGGDDDGDVILVADPTSPPAASFAADGLVQWFDLLYAIIRDEGLSPPVASRLIAYLGVAGYESVAPGIEDGRSLGGQVHGLGTLPTAPEGVLHWPSVVNTAFPDTLLPLVPNMSPASQTSVADLAAGQQADYATQVDAETIARSQAFGAAIAAAVVAWAEGDGYDFYNNCPYVAPAGPGLWEPTPPAFQVYPIQPCWGQLRTYVLAYAAECAVGPPPPYSEVPGSDFYNEAMEVYNVSSNPTPEELVIGVYWADNPVETGTPPGHWVRIVSQIAAQQSHTLDVSAEAYARLGLAVGDAFISCWEMKYLYNYVRPVTFIRDPNGFNDPLWLPPVGTPPFPEYTSGHSVQSGAAAQVLTDMFGDVAFVDDTHANLGLPARSFNSFLEAADEAAVSRLYGGIHFRSAIDLGVDQGRCIGQLQTMRLQFRQP